MFEDVLIRMWNDGTILFLIGAAVFIVAIGIMLRHSLKEE